MNSEFERKMALCESFYNELRNKIVGYEELESCNKDCSRYLCPKGTSNLLTYESKPERSFRISDHWNWFANVRKCPDEHYVQCYTRDLPFPKRRFGKGKSSRPISAACVCLFEDGIYRVIFGECFNRKTKKWSWVDNTVDAVLSMM